MKKQFIILMCIILLTACNSYTTSNDISISEKVVSQSITETAVKNKYEIKNIIDDNQTQQQKSLSDFLFCNIDNQNLVDILDEYSYPDKICHVICKEFYNNFSENDSNGLFVYRTVDLHADTPDYCYRELWYTDGITKKLISSTTGRNSYCGVLEFDDGPSLFYCVPEIVMGAPWQIAHCYYFKNGQAQEYTLKDTKQYFAFVISGDSNNKYDIYIGNNNMLDDEIIRKISESQKKKEPFQVLGWQNGEVIVISTESSIDNLLNNKAAELNGVLVNYIVDNQEILGLFCYDDYVYEYWYFHNNESELVLKVNLHMSDVAIHKECNKDFILLYQYVIGNGFPVNIVTFIDHKPVIISKYSEDDELPLLFYYPKKDVICQRIGGSTCGNSSILPYCWDDDTNSFVEDDNENMTDDSSDT